MRQVVLVVVLVAAAFLGGAFVNGPGLRWVQTQVLGSLGLTEGGEIASVDLKGPTSPDATADGSRPAKVGSVTVPGPLAPIPSLVADVEKDKAGASDPRATRPSGPQRRAAAPTPVASQPPSSPPPAATLIASSDATVGPPNVIARPEERSRRESSDTMARAPLDSSVKPAVASSSSPGRPAPDRGVAPALLDSLADLISAGAPPPDAPSRSPEASPSSPPRPGTGSQASPGDDWAALGRKMQALGVSRFTIEGQPGGRVVFSCLIPLAGRQAVAQRFEAEGDDGFQAAQAALRRIALWRATQPPQR